MQTHQRQKNINTHILRRHALGIDDMLSSLKPWVQIPWRPILQSMETGPTYLNTFLSQGLIS